MASRGKASGVPAAPPAGDENSPQHREAAEQHVRTARARACAFSFKKEGFSSKLTSRAAAAAF